MNIIKNKIFARTALGFLMILVFVFSINEVRAAGLIPCGGSGESACTLCHLIIGINSMMNYFYKVVFFFGIAAFAVAGVMYTVSSGQSSMMEWAKGAMKNAVIGIVIVFSAWLIVNYSLQLLGAKTDLGISNVKSWDQFECKGAVGTSGAPGSTSYSGTTAKTGGTGAACASPDTMKSSLNSGSPVCSGSCSLTSCMGKVMSKYGSIINGTSYVSGDSKKAKIIAAIICRESDGDEKTPNSSAGACGLMQLMPDELKSGDDCMNPTTNIVRGAEVYGKKLQQVGGKSFDGQITQEQMASAAYNCCKDGTNPNDQSQSCQQSDGWKSIPKWACPIDPGPDPKGNMCTVKDYVCDIAACIS